MSLRKGSMYKIGGRRYVDSQALANLARTHELVPVVGGWRMLVDHGALRFGVVEGRPPLPGQRGAVYSVAAEGHATVKEQRAAWARSGEVEAAGTFESWPGEGAKSCGTACPCAPCQRRQQGEEA